MQLFSSYVVALAKGFRQKKAHLYEKHMRKMLMKLTPERKTSQKSKPILSLSLLFLHALAQPTAEQPIHTIVDTKCSIMK